MEGGFVYVQQMDGLETAAKKHFVLEVLSVWHQLHVAILINLHDLVALLFRLVDDSVDQDQVIENI